jgi:hypothetical protein
MPSRTRIIRISANSSVTRKGSTFRNYCASVNIDSSSSTQATTTTAITITAFNIAIGDRYID